MIIFENVTKIFGDGSVGVKNISFSVDDGECVFITGASGSGKTTLLRLLSKEHDLSSGDILIDNKPISQISFWNIHKHRRRVGVIYQDYKLIEDKNVWENIALPLEIASASTFQIEERVTELLELVGLADHALYFPKQLSGGEAQRVAIARALANNPDIICADEPTGNLDPKTSLAIAHLLMQIQEAGTTLLFATHDLEVLKTFPHISKIHLDAGEIASGDNKTISINRKISSNNLKTTATNRKVLLDNEQLPTIDKELNSNNIEVIVDDKNKNAHKLKNSLETTTAPSQSPLRDNQKENTSSSQSLPKNKSSKPSQEKSSKNKKIKITKI